MILHTKYKWNNLLFPFAIFEAILGFLILSSEHKVFFCILTFVSAIPLLLNWKYFLVSVFAFGLIVMVYMLTSHTNSIKSDVDDVFRVNSKISMGGIVSIDGNNVLVKTKETINAGDEIKVIGKISKVVNTSDFDIVTYLKSLNVFYIISSPKIEVKALTNDIRVLAREYISNGGAWYSQVTPLLFLGEKTDKTKQLYDMSISMNVVHLFVISGFHISLLYMLLYKPMIKLKVNPKIAAWVPLVLIWTYLFFLGFPVSALRAGILTTIMVINKELLKKRFSSIQLVAFVMALMAIISPMSVFSLSFIFTFVATFVIVFVNGIEFKTKTRKYIAIIVFSYLSNVLIVMYTNHTFAVFGILFGVVLTPVFATIYSLSIFLFPFKWLMNYIDYAFVWIMKSFNTLNVLVSVPEFEINYVYVVYGATWMMFTSLSTLSLRVKTL